MELDLSLFELHVNNCPHWLRPRNPPFPRAQKKKTKRAAGSPAASPQLALCLRLAIDL
jgi:hypothetical protein